MNTISPVTLNTAEIRKLQTERKVVYLNMVSCTMGVKRWRSCLKHCAASQKVEVSISDGVFGIFHRRNSSGCTLGLGLTQPIAEMSMRNISVEGGEGGGGKGSRCLPYQLNVSNVLNSAILNLLEPSSVFRLAQGLLYFYFFLYCYFSHCDVFGTDLTVYHFAPIG